MKKPWRRILRILAWLPVLAVAGAVWLGGDDVSPTAVEAAFFTLLPYICLTVVVFNLLALVLLGDKWLLVPLSLICLLGFSLWGHLVFSKTRAPLADRPSLTVMTWNVQRFGEWVGRGRLVRERMACVAALVGREKPDVLVLQEVTRSQLLDLAGLLGAPPLQTIWIDYFGKGQDKLSGLAVMLPGQGRRLVVTQKKRLTLPPQWNYLFTEITGRGDLAGVTFNVLALHVAPPRVTTRKAAKLLQSTLQGDPESLTGIRALLRRYRQNVALQGAQAGEALRLIGRFRDPTLVMGDFNSTRDAALHGKLRQTLQDAWETAGWGFGPTRQWGDFLPLRVDYIYASHHVRVLSADTPPARCSDHLPVMAKVQLPAGKGKTNQARP